MSWNEADDEDYRRDEIDARNARNANTCRCSSDMPGRCPGQAYCPCCEADEEERDDA